MKRWRYFLLAAAMLCIIAIFFFLRRKPSPPVQEKRLIATSQPASSQAPAPVLTASPTPPPPNPSLAHQETQEEKLEKIFSHIINFYGKVIDEKGAAVEGAQIRYSAPSSFLKIEKGNVDGPITDSKGLFSITGKRGAGIYVTASHPDYYNTEQSSCQFSYFENTDRNPSASKPAIFMLRKKGTAEPLLKLKQVVKSVPKNGRPVQVGFSGKNGGDLTVQAWTSPRPTGAANNAPFAWKMRIAVPGGGLVAYDDQYQFNAPENGYVPTIDFDMPASGIDGKWRDRFEQTYFVKLTSGNYARMRFQMIAGGNHFAVVESYYNPTPGSRNLEFDPAKAVKAP